MSGIGEIAPSARAVVGRPDWSASASRLNCLSGGLAHSYSTFVTLPSAKTVQGPPLTEASAS